MEEFNKIEFKWLKVQNFLSIKDEIFFDFSKHFGMNYIFGTNRDIKDGGRNGVGKSAIFCDAILFALFGKTSKKINKSNIINRLVQKQCLVSIEFTVNNDTYLIESGIKPTYVNLYKNGDNVTKSTIAETRDFIETEILKTTFNIFKNSIILSVNNDSSSIFEMNAAAKRDFIERIFNLSVFGKMFTNVRKDLLVVDKEITSEQVKYTRLEKSLKEFNEKLSSFNTDKKANLKAISSKVKSLQSKIKSLKTDTSSYTKTLNVLDDEIEKFIEERADKKESLTEIASKIQYMKKDITSKQKVLIKYENIYNLVGECCKPLLDEELDFTKNKRAIDKLVKTVKESAAELKKAKETFDKINNKVDLLKSKKTEINRTISELEENNNEKNIASSKIEILKEQATKETEKSSPFEDLISSYTVDKDDAYKKLSEKMGQRQYLDFCEFVLSPEGVKKWIISDLINTLNSRITRYLEEMGAEYTVIFDPDFSCRFLTISGECDYHNFSSGEKMRVNLATVFAFRDILSSQGTISSSILVCDEILDTSIDSICIDAVLNILKRESSESRLSVYLVSHRSELAESENVDNVIELVKEDGNTRVLSDPQMDGA
tara:strand:+ start:2112 stop:3920 length:1809 start_codon:yes stop_codon:yes gene_type:complete